jgi:hypothetical protein
MQVTLQGNSALLSQTVTVSGQGTGTWYTRNRFDFVADGTSTTLTFQDTSLVTTNIDLLLDNVNVQAIPALTPTPTATPSPTVTPTPPPIGAFVNGSFESDYTGWTRSGNQKITSKAVTNGTKAVAFDGGNTKPNGVLSQTFATSVGQTYVLTFDLGINSYQSTAQMSTQVTVQGNGTLLSQTVALRGQGTGKWYTPKSFNFVADGTSATLTFQDKSLVTVNIDVLLDNVNVQAAAAPTPTPAPTQFTNGSFEQDYAGWTATGNQDVVFFGATDGIKATRFNAGQTAPNAVLSQSFATTAGQSYTLSFDYGVYSPVNQREQRLEVTVQGNGVLVAQVISQSAFGSSVQYTPRNYSFVADSSLTTLTFRDVSLTSDSVDSYLDNVQVK